jgi:hypothetical protein
MDRKPVCLREIASQKFYPGVHEGRYEGDVAGKPVELGNDQGGSVDPAGGQGSFKLWTVARSPAFDFDELADWLSFA